MGFVIQMQRRAVEALEPDAPKKFWPENLFKKPEGKFYKKEVFFNLPPDSPSGVGQGLYFYGFSIGVGTCSDIRGMDVAVFGYEAPRKKFAFTELLSRLPQSRYAVLLWPYGVVPLGVDRDYSEIRVDPSLYDPLDTVQIVELLSYHSSNADSLDSKKGCLFSLSVCLARTGSIASYNPI